MIKPLPTLKQKLGIGQEAEPKQVKKVKVEAKIFKKVKLKK